MAGERDLSGLGGISGPSDSNWVPTPGFPTAPATGGTPPNQPAQVLGTDQLQKSIDEFNQAVTKLEKVAQQMAGNGFGGGSGGGSNGGGSGFGPSTTPKTNGGGPTFSGSPIGATPTRAGYGLGGSDNAAPIGPNMQNGNFSQRQGLIGSGGAGNGGGASFGGSQSRNPNGTFAAGGSGAGGASGGGAGGTGGGQYASGNGGGASITGGLMGVASGLASLGGSNLSSQMAMTTMQQQGTLLAPGGTGNYGTYGDRMRAQAFGSGTYNTPRNTFAYNAQDASAGYGTLQQMAGAGIVSSTSIGRAGLGAAASFAGANPDLSYTQAAQAAQQMYTPSNSMKMMQLGYNATPLKMNPSGGAGGGANSMGTMVQSIMQRMYGGKSSTTPQGLAAAMEPGQVGYEDLLQAGMDPTTMAPTLEAYNRVTSGSKGKISDAQTQKLLQGAQGGNKQDISTLKKYGVTQSDISQTKSAQAQSTQNQSDITDSFTSGLTAASNSLTEFRKALDAILNLPGINQAVGGGEGALGGGKAMLGNVAGGAEMFGGAMMLKSAMGGGAAGSVLSKIPGIGKLFSGAGSSAAAGTEAGSVSAAEGAAGAGAAGAGGILGGAGLATILSKYLSGKAGTALGTAAGITKSTGSGIGHDAAVAGNDVINALPGGAATSSFLGGMLGLSHGGRITEGVRGKDTQPAMLAKDETVLNANASQAVGYDVIDSLNRMHAPGGIGGGTVMKDGVLYAASGAAILSDAKKYAGHKYVYGGPSNPQDGWDCSSFASYVLGHDEHLSIPGGSWATATNSGKSHGPVASAFAHLPGAHKVGTNPKDIQQGDILVWSTHVGFGVGPGTMFSAYDTAQGTLQTGKDLKNAGGPSGESLTIMRYGSGGGTASTSAASSSGGSSSPTVGSGGGGYNSTSEASNVSGALGGGGGGSVDLGVSASGPQTSGGSTGVSGGKYPNKSGNGIPQNAQAIANYLSGKGANKIAIAGILGNIMQESGGDPNAGSNPPGKGLLQILGDPGGTVQQDLAKSWQYIQANGGISPVNKATTAAQAATIFSDKYERPGNPQLSNRISYANKAYAAGYASGTTSTDSGLAVVGERGPELVNLPAGASISDAGTTSKLLGAQGVAQAPWSTGSSGSATGGVQLSFGDLNVTITGDTTRDTASNAATEIVQQVKQQLDKENIYASIRSGNKYG